MCNSNKDSVIGEIFSTRKRDFPFGWNDISVWVKNISVWVKNISAAVKNFFTQAKKIPYAAENIYT
jgi:hypothetical protein